MNFRTSRHRARLAGVAAAASIFAGAAAPVAAADFTMKISSPTVRSALEQFTETLKQKLEARTNGRIEVKGYPASQLGAIPRVIEGVQLGTIEAAQIPPEFLVGVDERFSIFSVPGVLHNVQHGRDALNDPEFKAAFWKTGQDKGIQIIAHNCDTAVDWATRNPIRTMEDLKGLKLRIFGSPIEREMLSRLGAAGVPMPPDEVLNAIQQHVIDGNKAGITVFVPFKYVDVVKYIWTPHDSQLCVLKFASKVWLDKLPADLKTAVIEESLKASDEVMPFTLKLDDQMYEAWKSSGGTITEFAPDEQKKFMDRIADVGDVVYKDRPQAKELLDLLKKVAKRHEKM